VANQFALVSFGFFCLSLAGLLGFHIGSGAQAQAPSQPSAWKFHVWAHNGHEIFWTILENGDVYVRDGLPKYGGTLTYAGSFWEGIVAPPSPIQHWEFVIGAWGAGITVFLQNGDIYRRTGDLANGGILSPDGHEQYMGNFWQGGPVPISPSTWGGAKGKYDGKK
jgi:hypothetical protein